MRRRVCLLKKKKISEYGKSRKWCIKNGNISKKIDNLKRSRKEMLEQSYTITEIKNSPKGFQRQIELAEEI